MSFTIKAGDISFAVFDCDGVILDSNAIKTEAFRQALDNYPGTVVEKLVEYHRKHGGISRYEKFRYFFDSLVNDPDESKYEVALDRFQKYCQENLREAPLVPGIVPFLHWLRERDILMFVVSGSDETELKAVLHDKQLSHFFKQILGSPVSKGENLSRLLEQESCNGGGVFFGDALLDFEIASEHNLDFVYVYQFSDWEGGRMFCQQRQVMCISDFRPLLSNDS